MSTPLYVRSNFSLLEGTMRPDQIAFEAKERGFSAVAIVEKHVMFSTVQFVKACHKYEVKPIIGLEVPVIWEQEMNVVLLAKENQGYLDLIQLSSQLNAGQKAIDIEVLERISHHSFVIILSVGGGFDDVLIEKSESRVLERFQQLREILPFSFYIGLIYQESTFFRERNNLLKKIAASMNVQSVAMSGVYYLNKQDERIYRILQSIDKGVSYDDKTLISAPDRYFYTQTQLSHIYDEDDLLLSDEIAASCSVDIYHQTSNLPHFKSMTLEESAQFLKQLAYEGLKKRLNYQQIPDVYLQRLSYECSVITSMNFSDYFLIVYDVIRYARSKHIYVGPGRGSAAGSLVSYCLGITHIDPIQYDLLFERFLNPERISMPDIDIDFPDNRRQEVIDYVKQVYGQDHVAHIITFGTLAAKQAMRDVGRVSHVPLSLIDRVGKSIPSAPKITIQNAYKESKTFRTLIDSSEQLQGVYKDAVLIEGFPRHVSTHAAGIVLSRLPLNEVVPTIEIDAQTKATQYSMDVLESLGLIKIDFLGLRNLTIIDNITETIRKSQPDFDILKIPLDDQKTFQLIANVDTQGLFQLESEGMKALIRKMKPHQFNDIADTIALFRPGPMQNIPLYLENRQNPAKIKYIHPDLKPIAHSTYGVLIYQEQIMQVVQKFAGFSLARADVLRKAMSKKNEAELLSLKQEFLDGCVTQGYSPDLATSLFELISKFANYGFNKSHSVAYALISYQMAYLKANYPQLFYCYLLSSVIGSQRKTMEYLDECRRRRIPILGLSLNNSGSSYLIEAKGIRYPFAGIVGFGSATIKVLLQERQKRGLFNDYYDAIARLNLAKITKKQMETLIYAGAFDEFNLGRLTMIASLDEAFDYANLIKIEEGGEPSLSLGLVSKPMLKKVQESQFVIDEQEFNALGLYLSSHPIAKIRADYPHTSLCSDVMLSLGKKQIIALLSKVKQHKTKTMEPMAFVSFTDESGPVEGVIFPKTFKQLTVELKKGMKVLCTGTVRDDSFIVDQIEIIE